MNFVDVVQNWKRNYFRWRNRGQSIPQASQDLIQFREFSQLLESFFLDWMGIQNVEFRFERIEHQEPYVQAQYSVKLNRSLLVLSYNSSTNQDSLYREPRQRLSLLNQPEDGKYEEVANLDLPDNLSLLDPGTKWGLQALEGFFYLIQGLIQENRGLGQSNYPYQPNHVNAKRHGQSMIEFIEFFNQYMARLSWLKRPLDFDRKSWRISEPELLAGYEDDRLGVYLKASLGNKVGDPTMVITNSWEQPDPMGQAKLRKIRCLSLPLDFRAFENLDSESGLVYLRITQLVHVILHDIQIDRESSIPFY